MLKYKIDVLAALKEEGYNTTRIRKEHILSESTVQKLRNGVVVSVDNLDRLCRLLHCQPCDIIEFFPERE